MTFYYYAKVGNHTYFNGIQKSYNISTKEQALEQVKRWLPDAEHIKIFSVLSAEIHPK